MPILPSKAVAGHQYVVGVVSGEFDGVPATGRWIGIRDGSGRWQLWRASGGQVLFGLRDEEIAVIGS